MMRWLLKRPVGNRILLDASRWPLDEPHAMAKAKQCGSSRLTKLIVFLPFLGLLRFSSQTFTPKVGCSLRRAPTRSARLAGRPSQLYKQHSEDFLATEGERIYSDVDPASVKVSREEDGYAFDESVFSDEDKPEDIGPVHYYGVTDAGWEAGPKLGNMKFEFSAILPYLLGFVFLNVNCGSNSHFPACSHSFISCFPEKKREKVRQPQLNHN